MVHGPLLFSAARGPHASAAQVRPVCLPHFMRVRPDRDDGADPPPFFSLPLPLVPAKLFESPTLPERGADVIQPVLLSYYLELPERQARESTRHWTKRFQTALEVFKTRVQARYAEGTLQPLLVGGPAEVRQAAVLAIGLIGGMAVNAALAARLRDEDPHRGAGWPTTPCGPCGFALPALPTIKSCSG